MTNSFSWGSSSSWFSYGWEQAKSSASHSYEAATNAAYATVSSGRAVVTGLLGASAYSTTSGHLMGFNAVSSAASLAGVEYAPTVATGLRTGLTWMVSNPLTAVGCFVAGALLLHPEGAINAVKGTGHSLYHTAAAVLDGVKAVSSVGIGLAVGASEVYETISSYFPEKVEVEVSVAEDLTFSGFLNQNKDALESLKIDVSKILGNLGAIEEIALFD